MQTIYDIRVKKYSVTEGRYIIGCITLEAHSKEEARKAAMAKGYEVILIFKVL